MAMLVAILAVALVALASLLPLRQQQVLAQRERERDLLFVGDQYRQALARYAAATPGPVPQFPRTLQDLLEDKRYATPQRHLRQLYVDPMTGVADWQLIRHQDGIVGLASRSHREPLKRRGFAAADQGFEDAKTYAEWRFVAPTPAPGAAAPGGPVPPPAPGGAPVSGTPPTQPAPPAAGTERRAECLRSYSQALNHCLVVEPSNVGTCRNEARLAMLACLRGG